jgi:NAD(P)-dependent dehydrogenase (short-subunit alcohol dehydrogenase family)
MTKVWFITGGARGFGAAIARAALRTGDVVVVGVRHPEAASGSEQDGIVRVALDVVDEDSVIAAVDVVRERFGRIDVLVNNAGRGMIGAVEEVSDGEARAVFDVNYFGAMAVTRAVLPVMRAQHSGQIVFMSSMGGVLQSGSGWGVYGATKFAVEGAAEALRNETEGLGISVTLVEPGVFRTDFLDASSVARAATQLDDYAETSGRTRSSTASRNHQQLGDPGKAAAAIVDTLAGPDVPLRLPLGTDATEALRAKAKDLLASADRFEAVAAATRHADH